MSTRNDAEVRIRRRIRILAAVYGVLLVWIILFKTAVSAEDIRYLFGLRHLNLVPFQAGENTRFFLWELMANFLVFVPFGLYLKMLGLRTGRTLFLGAAASAAFETIQYAAGIGACDVTDLITNTAGCAAGVEG